MSEIYIRDDSSQSLDRIIALLTGIGSSGGMQKAVNAALRRAASSGRAKAGQFVAERYTISAATFKKYFESDDEFEGAGDTTDSLKVKFRGSVIPLIEFQTSYSKGGGVNVKVKKGGGGTLTRAFIADFHGRHDVYERVGKGKGGLKKLYGPSAAHMLEDSGVNEKMQKHMQDVFDQRMEHEVNRMLNGW